MPNSTSKILRNIILNKLPMLGKNICIAIGICWLICVSWIDYLTTYEANVSVLYLFSIFLITMSAGLRGGLSMALACAIARRLTSYLTGLRYSSVALYYYNTFASFVIYSAVAYLFWELHQSYISERVNSRTDELTKISNRRSFYELAENELLRCRRSGRSLNLLVIDADGFKSINDNFGHLTGDEVLQVIAQTIKTNTRATDIVARLGGDEFAVVLTEISHDQAITVTNKIRTKLLERMRTKKWPVTFSIGIACGLPHNDSLEIILHKADMAMYKSKATGKDCITSDKIL